MRASWVSCKFSKYSQPDAVKSYGPKENDNRVSACFNASCCCCVYNFFCYFCAFKRGGKNITCIAPPAKKKNVFQVSFLNIMCQKLHTLFPFKKFFMLQVVVYCKKKNKIWTKTSDRFVIIMNLFNAKKCYILCFWIFIQWHWWVIMFFSFFHPQLVILQ